MLKEMSNFDGDRLKNEEKEHVKEIMSSMDTPDFKDHIPNNEMMSEFLNMRLSVDWQAEYKKFEAEKELIMDN